MYYHNEVMKMLNDEETRVFVKAQSYLMDLLGRLDRRGITHDGGRQENDAYWVAAAVQDLDNVEVAKPYQGPMKGIRQQAYQPALAAPTVDLRPGSFRCARCGHMRPTTSASAQDPNTCRHCAGEHY